MLGRGTEVVMAVGFIRARVMNKKEKLRLLRTANLAFAKGLADQSDPDRIIVDGHTGDDLLRIIRNRIWYTCGPEELEELEAETDLGI